MFDDHRHEMLRHLQQMLGGGGFYGGDEDYEDEEDYGEEDYEDDEDYEDEEDYEEEDGGYGEYAAQMAQLFGGRVPPIGLHNRHHHGPPDDDDEGDWEDVDEGEPAEYNLGPD